MKGGSEHLFCPDCHKVVKNRLIDECIKQSSALHCKCNIQTLELNYTKVELTTELTNDDFVFVEVQKKNEGKTFLQKGKNSIV